MRQLSTYIEYLLMTRHYAFVPGLGGFMLQEVEARFEGNELQAPRRAVQFNRFVTHNDGMLVNVVMSDTGSDYDTAATQVSQKVAALINQIKQGTYQLGHLGILSLDAEQHVVFSPADTDALHYGMSPVSMKPWRQLADEQSGKTSVAEPAEAPIVQMRPNIQAADDVIILSKLWLRRAAVVLFILCFYFTHFLPVGQSDNSSHQASVLSTQVFNWMRSEVCRSKEHRTHANASTATTAPQASSAADRQATTTDASATNVLTESTPVSQSATSAVVAPSRLYYIIVASCASEIEAQRTIRQFARKGTDGIGTLEKNGRYRLYIRKYTDRKEAEAYLLQLRNTPGFEEAWLHPVQILKEKDNDPTTMELSHANNRAENDQG